MKRLVVSILLVVALDPAALARVDITYLYEGNGVVAVSYQLVGEPNEISMFTLDVTVDNGANIVDVNCNVSYDYWVHPGSIYIVNGQVVDFGSCVADPCEYPEGTLPGIGSSGITVEMGALYEGDSNAPPSSGMLFKVTVDKECCITITENERRGGVVSEDPDHDVDVNSPSCPCPCMGDSDADDDNDASDINSLMLYLFYNGDPGQGWKAPVGAGLECMDLDDDGYLDSTDMNNLLLHLFFNGDPGNGWLTPSCYSP